MEVERTVSEKGQIVIPKDIRRHMGLKPGSEVVFDIEDGVVTMKSKKSGREIVEEFCSIPIKRKPKPLTTKRMKKIFAEEYAIP